MGKKQMVLEDLFRICMNDGSLIFDNNLVKEVCKKHKFGNPFDVTALDNTEKFPPILLEHDYFISHLGKGRHKFIKGIPNGYHSFEPLDEDEIVPWRYKKSLLNELDTSESNILSVISNQRILHDFLYQDISINPKVYNARRTKMDLSYMIGQEKLVAEFLQMEIDFTTEYNGIVTVFEGKNNFRKDFAKYQLFHPFLYYSAKKDEHSLDIRGITCCYVQRKRVKNKSQIRLHLYEFTDRNDINSIELLSKAQYNLSFR